MRTEITFQTIHTVDSTVTNQNNNFLFGSSSYYDTTPKPNAEFTSAQRSHSTRCTYLGSEADKASINWIGLSAVPVYEGEERPENLLAPSGDNRVSSSYTGEYWFSKKLNPGGDPTFIMDGGGGSIDADEEVEYPEYYAADLYLNNEKVAELDLTLQKGEAE